MGRTSALADGTARVGLRGPIDAEAVSGFFAAREVQGMEQVVGSASSTSGSTSGPQAPGYARTLRLAHGAGWLRTAVDDGDVVVECCVADARDVDEAITRGRWLFDAETDLEHVESVLARDPVLAESVRRHRGLRVPGQVDAFEVAVRAIVGQQISVAGARTVLSRIVTRFGDELPAGLRAAARAKGLALRLVFPRPESLAAADPETLPMPRARGRAIVSLARAVAEGRVLLDRRSTETADIPRLRQTLVALPGIGPWTADYLLLRGFGAPDVFLPSDLGVRHGLARLGLGGVDPARWAPVRSYAMMHVWHALSSPTASGTELG